MLDQLAEDSTPRQSPTLTELEEARAGVALARQIDLEWLMAHDDPPDVGVLLEQLVSRPAWHALANCRGADPDLFFPERGTRRPVQALVYCKDCSVRADCLASALEVAWTTGVWGGNDDDADPAVHAEVEPIGLNRHNGLTTTPGQSGPYRAGVSSAHDRMDPNRNHGQESGGGIDGGSSGACLSPELHSRAPMGGLL